MREYFAQFGSLSEAMVMRDPTTKHSRFRITLRFNIHSFIQLFRGFGFVTFTENESVEKVIQYGVHTLDGKKIDPKVAFPKESTPKVKFYI